MLESEEAIEAINILHSDIINNLMQRNSTQKYDSKRQIKLDSDEDILYNTNCYAIKINNLLKRAKEVNSTNTSDKRYQKSIN